MNKGMQVKKYILILCLFNISFAPHVKAEISRVVLNIGLTSLAAGTIGALTSGISWEVCSYEKVCPLHTQKVGVTYNYECTYCEENPIGNHCNQTQPGYCVEVLEKCQTSNGTIIDSERKACEVPKIVTMLFGGVFFTGIGFIIGARCIDQWEMYYDVIDEETPVN